MPGSAAGEKEVRSNLVSISLRWTQSCPRTGGVLHAAASIPPFPATRAARAIPSGAARSPIPFAKQRRAAQSGIRCSSSALALNSDSSVAPRPSARPGFILLSAPPRLPLNCLCLPLKSEISNGFVDFLTQRRAVAHFLGTTCELCHPERSVPTLFPAKIAPFRFSRRDAQSRDLSSSLSKTEDLNRAISNLKLPFALSVPGRAGADLVSSSLPPAHNFFQLFSNFFDS